jgi:glycosyltransferase involved in cell wall biosynthesis
MQLPLVSFGIPTYNEERTIERCLESIFSQDYPRDRLEVIIIDDGSSDRTLEICARYPVRIIRQNRSEGRIQAFEGASGGPECGRRVGVEAANGEFVVLFSADNELARRDWLAQMVKPVVEDGEIAGVRPPVLASREDSAINRYLALMQIPPLEFYLMWQLRPPVKVIAKDGYFVEILASDCYPAEIGGNGSLLRKDAILKAGNVPANGSDIDLICHLVREGFTKYAYVPEAVVYHHYVGSYWAFIKKLRGKVRWFLRYPREYPWLPRRRRDFFEMLKWILFCSSFIGPLSHGFRLRKKGDLAWLYHPFACLTQVLIYGACFLTSRKGLSSMWAMVMAVVKGTEGGRK